MRPSFRLAQPALATAAVALGTATWLLQAEASIAPAQSVERGRYLVRIAGCNDCHTAGYAMADGKVPESEWLKGDHVGWRGPWGTTYAPNLRILMSKLSESEWVDFAKTAQMRPPMPWFNLHAMAEPDLRDMYRFVRTLGPVGEPAPAFVPPEREPQGPVVAFPMPPKG